MVAAVVLLLKCGQFLLAHNSEVTRLVLLVEEELPTLQKNTTAATSGEGIDFS
jgi:hypothetical protein